MADQTNRSNPGSPGGNIAESATERLKDQASERSSSAKDMGGQTADKIKDAVSDKGAGADYVSSLAETIRRAGKQFDNDLPVAGKYIRKAASQVENVADSIRNGDFNDLVRNARSFAKRQPTVFFGIVALAGFAAVRFIKSSSDGSTGALVNRPLRQAQPSPTGYRDELSG